MFLFFIGLTLAVSPITYDTIKIPGKISSKFEMSTNAVSPLGNSSFQNDSLVSVYSNRILFKELYLDRQLYAESCPHAKFNVFVACKNDTIDIGVDINQNDIFESGEIRQIPSLNKRTVSYTIHPKQFCGTGLIDSSVIHLIPFVNQVRYHDVSTSDTMLQLTYSRGFSRYFILNDTLILKSHSQSLYRNDSSYTFKYIVESPSGISALYPDRDLLRMNDAYYVLGKNLNKDTLYLTLAANGNSKTKINKIPADFLNKLSTQSLKTDGQEQIKFAKKFILLDFWATWCVPCIKSMPHLNEINKNYEKNIQVIGLCIDDYKNMQTAKRLTKKNKIKFEQYFVSAVKNNSDSLSLYGIITFPTYILIDDVGNVLQLKTDISKIDFTIIK